MKRLEYRMQTVDPVNPNKIDEDEPLTQTNHNSVETIKLVHETQVMSP